MHRLFSRDYPTVLNEAELLSSSPEIVTSRIKTRYDEMIGAEESNEIWNDAGWDDEVEEALLGRNDPLITFALARYGMSKSVLRQLVLRIDPLALRIAIFANAKYAEQTLSYYGEEDKAWIAKLTDLEFAALFGNAALPEDFIEDFMEGKGCWLVLDDAQRRRALEIMSVGLAAPGESKRRFRMGRYYAHPEYSHRRPFYEAWRLAASVPVNSEWAKTLSFVYNGLGPQTYLAEDPLAVAERWSTPKDDVQVLEDERESNQRGELSAYQTIRWGLARLAGSRSQEGRDAIKGSDDAAIRCGGYSLLRLTPDEIISAYERDGPICIQEISGNIHVWKQEETREALRKICVRCEADFKEDVHFSHTPFEFKYDEMERTHPDWFLDKDADWADVPPSPQLPPEFDPLNERLAQIEAATASMQILLAKMESDGARLQLPPELGSLAGRLEQIEGATASVQRQLNQVRICTWIVIVMLIAVFVFGG